MTAPLAPLTPAGSPEARGAGDRPSSLPSKLMMLTPIPGLLLIGAAMVTVAIEQGTYNTDTTFFDGFGWTAIIGGIAWGIATAITIPFAALPFVAGTRKGRRLASIVMGALFLIVGALVGGFAFWGEYPVPDSEDALVSVAVSLLGATFVALHAVPMVVAVRTRVTA